LKKGGWGGFNVVIQIIILKPLCGDAGFGGFHYVHVGSIQCGQVDIARVTVFDFQIAHAAAHIPNDIFSIEAHRLISSIS